MTKKNNSELPTRLTVLHDGLIVGKDLGGIFKEGEVYDVRVILDTYIIRPLGKSSLPDDGRDNIVPNKNSTVSSIICGSNHLITEKEYENIFGSLNK